MRNRKLQKITSVFLTSLLSVSLAIFAFHSHDDLGVSTNQSDFQHSISIDTVFCPICAHNFKSPTVPSISGEKVLREVDIHTVFTKINVVEAYRSFEKGRSPPIVG